MQSMVLMLNVQKQDREHVNHLPCAVNRLPVRRVLNQIALLPDAPVSPCDVDFGACNILFQAHWRLLARPALSCA
jgi:hypothetical protein